MRERRKLVTVLFADVVGSTALGDRVDSETLRWAMQRWSLRMRDVVERHGGIVEKYIGDAVMAVFGIPVAHEDDALRAVRAAAEMRDEVATLREELHRERGVELAIRIGVNTGEAVTGADADGGVYTSGDIVNVAARLEQAAPTGEVLLGRDTVALVGHAVEADEVAPLTLKGKRATVRGVPAADGRAARARPAAAPPRGAGRTRERAVPAAAGCRPDRQRAGATARHRPRRRRRRQDAPGRRGRRHAARRRHGRGRPLPALRRRAHLVAAGRGTGDERPAGRGRDRGGTGVPVRGGGPQAGRRARRSRGRVLGDPHRAAGARPPAAADPRRSMTSSGPTRRCSTWSST